MKPRHPFLLALVAAAAIAGQCSGCASPAGAERTGGYVWIPDPAAPHCTSVLWRTVAPERVPGLCYDPHRGVEPVLACEMDCLVISRFTEEEAKHIDLWGDTLWDHERRHALEGLVHP